MTDVGDLWATCSSTLRAQVPEPTWNAWLAPLRLTVDDGKYRLAAPNSMVCELVHTRFLGMITRALSVATGVEAPPLELVVQPPPAAPDEGARTGEGNVVLDAEAQTRGTTATYDHDGPRSHDHPPSFAATNASRLARPPGRAGERRPHPSLNPRYTFETFVVGGSNRFANAAAQRVAEEPARTYNPLFIYGASGLGKTHILHSIGHYVHDNFTNLNVCYVSTETFLNEFIESIRTKDQSAFKRRYRNSDVLLVDDIQLLTGKKETQEEFFYTFNSFYEAQKQIVISSDRHPRSIATLEDRLRSRFESGLITDIQPPELETRVAILRKKLESERAGVPEDVLELIATCVKDNIRELEGALIRVSAFASIHNVPVTMELATEVLSDLIAQSAPRQVTPKEILEVTSRVFDFSIEDLCGPSRRRPLVQARQIAMYLFRVLTNYSYPAIAIEFGHRDHTTVMHACNKIEAQMSLKRQVYDQVTDLIHKLKEND